MSLRLSFLLGPAIVSGEFCNIPETPLSRADNLSPVLPKVKRILPLLYRLI